MTDSGSPVVPAETAPVRVPFSERLRTRRGIAIVFFSVVALGFLLYLPTVRYDFAWDDASLIAGNELLARAAPQYLFSRAFWAGAPNAPDGPARLYYRPLTALSFWLDLRIAGARPWHFHLTNALLNALVAGLLALIVWELLHSSVWAAFAGLLFAVHPAHVESVAFVSGRTDLLLAFFICVASFGLVRSLRKRDIRWWALVPSGFFLALLSKETAILFPVLVALAPLLTQTRYDRRYWILLGSTLLVAAGFLLLHTSVTGALRATGPGLLNSFVGAINTFGLYVRMLLWPFTHKVKFPLDRSFLTLTPYAIVALLFFVSVPLVALRRRFWSSLFGYLWVVLFLLPVTVFSIGPLAAERLAYLPSAGFIIIVVTLFSRLLRTHAAARKVAAVALVLTIIVLARDSLVRSRVWQNDATLFAAMIREAPDAPSGYANLADALRQADPDSALRLYREALRLDQGFVHAHINAGILYGSKKDFRQALHHLRLANDLRPGSVQILNNLGLAFLTDGRPESALVYLDQATQVEPNSATTRFNRAAALLASGLDPEPELRRALTLDPKLVPAHLALADLYERRDESDKALFHLEQALRLEPKSPSRANRLGTLHIRCGDSASAAQRYRDAIKLDSTFVPALYNQAVLSAAQGDTATALALAERAYRLRPDVVSIRELYLVLKAGR